jgi:enamine deaminase RidA (YjgF/YER057c/UK114 family)
MKRTAINPSDWSLRFGFNQGELVEGSGKLLFCAGQVATDDRGRPQHAGDVAAQASLALDNLEAVLAKAGMSLANVVRLTIFTTQIDAVMQNFGVLTSRLDAAGVKPAQTLIGVARLALPDFLIEIEATAAA